MSPPCIRVIDLETAGNGPSDVCEIGWQDVVQEEDGHWQVSEARGSVLVNPGRPISPDTMAIHHIQDHEVAGAPFWREVAASILRPPHPIVALAAHRAAFEQRIARRDWPVALHGSVPGNAHYVFGRSCQDFPTRCCVISEGRKV